ncbi:hypothetical protein [Legionella norrlandica]|uniref:hypothetical protein n=1 Tax=Legionella norrlandica TaxID=1498499 RepID=UPI000A668C40|nr:hypothetical protein [Legionella norrlandica]
MTPIISHLLKIFPELSSHVNADSGNWTFIERIKQLGPDFYSKVARLHPVLNMEYSILCQQLRHNLSSSYPAHQEQVKEQLIDALQLAELLEYTYLHYIVVPREVVRLSRHKAIYKELLTQLAGYSFASDEKVEAVAAGLSITQEIRNKTALANWFRIFLSRSKRVINLLDSVVISSEVFRDLISVLDKYTNPFFAYLGWCFFVPRLSTNLALLIKHTILGHKWEKRKNHWIGMFAFMFICNDVGLSLEMMVFGLQPAFWVALC